MNSIVDDKSGVDFKYFIKLAIQKKLTWDCVATILDQLTSNLQLSKHLNSILLEELKESELKHCKNPKEHLIENKSQKIDIKADAEMTESQDDQDFEFDHSDTDVSENFDHKRDIAYNFEYDFVGTNGIETKRLTIFNSPKDGTNEIEGQNGDENCDLKEQETIKQHANETKVPIEISQESLNDQFEVPKDNRKYHCKECKKVFAWQSNLIRHEQIHKEKNERICEKKFKCKNCSKGFASKSTLNRHENIHREDNPFICKTCSKAFTNITDLNRHETVHSGVKPFECKICMKAFLVAGQLRKHERIHTGEKP